MPLRPAQKGYRYQDIISATIVSKLLFKNDATLIRVDEKDKKGDIVDDLKIFIENKIKINYQVKYSKNRELSLDDFKKDKELDLKKIIDYSLSDETNNEFCMILRWSYPTDCLENMFYECEYKYAFGISKTYKIHENCFDTLLEKIGIDNKESYKNVLKNIVFMIDAPGFSGKIQEPGVLEKILLSSCERLGVGFFPNDNISVEDFSIKLIDYIDFHRSDEKFTFIISDAIKDLKIKCNYGRITERFEVDYNIFTPELTKVESMCKIFSANEKTIVIGEPGSGKSYLMVQIEEYLRIKNIKFLHHYMFSGTIDEYSDVRLDKRYVIGNFINALLNIYPEMKEKYGSFDVDIDKLNYVLSSVKEPLYVFVDGIDHAYREYLNKYSDYDIIEELNKIKTTKYVHIVYISQPLKELMDCEGKTIEISRWEKNETFNLIEKINSEASLELKDAIFKKSCGNPLYTTYLSTYSKNNDIKICPNYTGRIQDYYEYLEKSIEPFYLVRYVATIPFYFDENDFCDITNAGEEGLAFLRSIIPLLSFDRINKGYKVYHESFKRYILDRCIEKKININKVKEEIVSWLDSKDFYANAKAYFNLVPLQYELKMYDEIIAKCNFDYLVKSAAYGYTIEECKKNLDYLKKTSCTSQNFEAYTRYMLLISCINQYGDSSFPFYDNKEFFNAFFALYGNDSYERFMNNDFIKETNKTSIVLSGLINNFNLDIEKLNTVGKDDRFYVNEPLMINVLNPKIKNIKLCKINQYGIIDLFDACYYGKCFEKIDFTDSVLAKMFYNFIFNENKFNVKVDDYYLPHGENVYKFNYFENFLNINEFLNSHIDDMKFRRELSLLSNSFYKFLIELLYLIKKEYNNFLAKKNINSFESNCISILQKFNDKVTPFSGNPRAFDFTDRAFKKLFINLLLLPIRYFENKSEDYFELVLNVKRKLSTTVRGSNMGCISDEDLLNSIYSFKDSKAFVCIVNKMANEIEKENKDQLYCYSFSNYISISYLVSIIDKKRAEELFLKGISYCFCYGERKDIFFSEIIDAYQYGFELDSSFDSYSADVANAAYSLLYHTDRSGTADYFNEWIRVYLKHNKEIIMNYLFTQDCSCSNWIVKKAIADLIELDHKSFDLEQILVLVEACKFSASDFNYEVLIDIILESDEKEQKITLEKMSNYLASISNAIPNYIIEKINKCLKDKNIKHTLSLNPIFNEENSSVIRKAKELKNITIEEFYNVDKFEDYTVESIRGLFETVDFDMKFLNRLIQYFDKYSHRIDYLDAIFESNTYDENKKMYLDVIYFYFKSDGWYKRFICYEYMNEAFEINPIEAKKFLFYIIEKTKDIFHGYSGLSNNLLSINDEKQECAKDIIDFGLIRIPDRVEKITHDDFKIKYSNDIIVDLVILKFLNDFHWDTHMSVLSYIEDKIKNNQIEFLKKGWGSLNLTPKMEILSIFNKLIIKTDLFIDDSPIINAYISSNKNTNYGGIISINSQDDLYLCKYMYNYDLLNCLCVKFDIDFSLFGEELYKLKCSDYFKDAMDSLVSISEKRIIENYLQYEMYLKSIDNVFGKLIAEQKISIDDIHSFSENVINPLANQYIYTRAINENEGFVKVASFVAKNKQNDREYPCILKTISYSSLDNDRIINNFDLLNSRVEYQKNLIITFDDKTLAEHSINQVNDKGMIKYYKSDVIVGYFVSNKSKINGLSENYQLYFEEEQGALYISMELAEKLEIETKNQVDSQSEIMIL